MSHSNQHPDPAGRITPFPVTAPLRSARRSNLLSEVASEFGWQPYGKTQRLPRKVIPIGEGRERGTRTAGATA